MDVRALFLLSILIDGGTMGSAMNKVLSNIIKFVKKETVLTISWVLAIISMFVVKPDAKYVEYIDFRSLATLWCLMIVVAGFTDCGTFDRIGRRMLLSTKYVWQLVSLLVALPFFFSMFITNDVALLTFVPFSIHIVKMSKKDELLIPIVAFQTLAANLGSMFTPIGNPQNIYLYVISGLGIGDFLSLIPPYTCMSLLLLCFGIVSVKGKRKKIFTDDSARRTMTDYLHTANDDDNHKRYEIIYGAMFIIAVLSVAFPKVLWYPVICAVILMTCLVVNRKLIVSIDYALLFTFVGFFLFTGNLERIGEVREFLVSLVEGHEMAAGIISSQLISNVPAALLLSDFTDDIRRLIVAVNLGGLGTLIASMASLISFKLLAHRRNEMKGRYLVYFTVVSVIFLAVLCAFHIFNAEYGFFGE